MPIPSISLLLGLVLLAYLSTFAVFAVIRVLTGVSIQRVGYSGFRRLAFSPRHGVRITVRGVGLSPHRPTFALPTWCSLVITELRVTVDLEELGKGAVGSLKKRAHANGSASSANGDTGKSRALDGTEEGENDDGAHGKLWERLNEIKEQVKRLHGQIEWLRLVDLVTNTVELCVVGVGSVCVERANVSVDTRSQTVDRSRLFQHSKAKGEVQQPAEWKCLIRSMLFTPEGRKSTEVLDYATLSVHGLLHRELQGLRDASVALKLGRVNVPSDDIEYAQQRAVYLRGLRIPPEQDVARERKTASGESEPHDTPEERIVRAISDSRAFIASILRGMQEVQLAVGFFGLSKRLSTQTHFDRSIYFNLAMKEVGLDILRLDSRTPAHRMYFARNDIAHQGLLTAIAISAGIDDGHKHPERMLYVPMITATVKTTLPSRAIHMSSHDSAGDRNTNVLYANLVCTSPSVDLDPHHLPLVLAMLKGRDAPASRQKQDKSADHHHLISRLLPKASIKISIQEPVVRVSLPPMDTTRASEDDFDLLISTTSSMALELESSHSQHGQMHYGFAVNYRHTSHELYHQTSASERHDLMRTDTCELKVDVNAIPDATVTAFARLQTCTVYLVRPDICEGIRQINRQMSSSVLAKSDHQPTSPKLSFLRKVPAWLEYVRIEGNEFAVQVAGVDKILSHDTRGFSLELESWSSEYRAHREDKLQIDHRRRISARLPSSPDKTPDSQSRSSSPRRAKETFADGRRLTVHLQNLEGLIIDSIDDDANDSFLSVPRFEVAFSTSTDATGPVFHINSHAKSILLAYSLYRHYAIGVAVMVIKRTFYDDRHAISKPLATTARPSAPQVPGSTSAAEITTIDCRIGLLQVKATMPSDPRMMLQVFGFEAGRHRWASPFMRCPLARLYVRAPSAKAAWSRIIGVKALRVDLRDIKRKHGSTTVTEKTVDLAVETVRIGVPHQLVVHDIFDNITNVVKTTKQMQHNFMTESKDYILTKEPEGPKRVPRVSFRAQLFVFDIEDSSFEWKL
ncbi:Protein SABRE, partial [Oleoguttula sp. CCFEE 5521]